ncbi:MAG: MGMT family protein [Candidatus Hadarchaeota archaeon]|nr:MGMT family protein [Candidatus Hadarchaeota archaeon]
MTEFQDRVLRLVLRVPRGRVTTYKGLARALGKPRAYRAIANVLARNPRSVEIPCHRVVRSNGKIGGYSLGTEQKAVLLNEEGVKIKGGRVNLRRYLFKF